MKKLLILAMFLLIVSAVIAAKPVKNTIVCGDVIIKESIKGDVINRVYFSAGYIDYLGQEMTVDEKTFVNTYTDEGICEIIPGID